VKYPKKFSESSSDQNYYFDPSVFERPALGTFVTGQFRNYVDRPGFQNHNLGLMKDFRIGETHTLTLRAESFNWVNHPNWDGPQTNPTNSQFGKVQGKNSQRNMQLSLRYTF